MIVLINLEKARSLLRERRNQPSTSKFECQGYVLETDAVTGTLIVIEFEESGSHSELDDSESSDAEQHSSQMELMELDDSTHNDPTTCPSIIMILLHVHQPRRFNMAMSPSCALVSLLLSIFIRHVSLEFHYLLHDVVGVICTKVLYKQGEYSVKAIWMKSTRCILVIVLVLLGLEERSSSPLEYFSTQILLVIYICLA